MQRYVHVNRWIFVYLKENNFFFNIVLMFIYFWERERMRKGWGLGDRGSEAGPTLRAENPTWGSNPWTTSSWSELKLDAQPTKPPRRPKKPILNSGVLQSLTELWVRHFGRKQMFLTDHISQDYQWLYGLWAIPILTKHIQLCVYICVGLIELSQYFFHYM